MATRKTNAQLQAEVDRLTAELTKAQETKKRIVRETIAYGHDNGSCRDGMAEFVSSALDVSTFDARRLMDEYGKVRYTVTLTFDGPIGWDETEANTDDVAAGLVAYMSGDHSYVSCVIESVVNTEEVES